MHISQKLQHFDDKQLMFLYDIPRNLITALAFHQLISLNGYNWFMAQNMENFDFCTLVK